MSGLRTDGDVVPPTPRAMSETRRWVLPIYGVFFLSGFSGLIYQTVWQRLVGLFAGTETVSATLTVGAFLFGLGVGSLVGGSLADRLGRAGALRAFALCEVLIAACALLTRPVLYDGLFGALVTAFDDRLLVFATVVIVLLPPTLLMGMSLPLLARAMVDDVDRAADRIGWLYAVNTIGAGAGAFVAGQLLIGIWGIEGTVRLAAAMNLLVGLVALAAATTAGPSWRSGGSTTLPAHGGRHDGGRVALWSAVVFASGFLIISLEIVWFRVLGALMQSNAYAFPLILSVFLVADGLGILAGIGVVRRTRDPLGLFLRLQGFMALLALGSLLALWLLGHRVDLGWALVEGLWFDQWPDLVAKVLRLSAYGAMAVVLVGPPAFLLGMSFPICQKAVQDDPGAVGRRVGTIQFANILGNTAGALVTGLVLLHLLGTSGTLVLVGLAGLALTTAALARPRRGAALAIALPLLAMIVALPGNTAFWARLHGTAPADGARIAEDRSGVVALRRFAETSHLYVGGKWQSDALPYRDVQGAMGALAAFAHPGARTAMLVGYGGGGSLYATGLNPAIERIRVVEIVRPVLTVMDDLARESRDPVLMRLIEDRRIERITGDGRHLIFSDPTRFDVLKVETISPRTANSGFLYSLEYFREVRRRLAPGGIVVQWAATERTVATFVAAFPHVLRLGDALIGSEDPIRFDMAAFEKILRGPAAPDLAAAGWSADVIVGWLSSRPPRTWTPGDPRPFEDINTDLFPRDEYFLNR